MEKQTFIYKGLTISVRWSSVNACYVLEAIDNEEVVLIKFRSSHESDDDFLSGFKSHVESYLEGADLRVKVKHLFSEL
jgi:hypothetical protein